MFAPITLLQDNIHHVYDSPTGGGYYAEWFRDGLTNLNKLVSGSGTSLTSSSVTMTAGSLYNQTLILDNTYVRWLINGTDASPAASDTSYRTGLYAGIQPYAGASVKVDVAFIRNYNSPEPTWG